VFVLACGSLRAIRAVTVFVVASHVAFAVFVPSFRKAPFLHSHRIATARKRSPSFVRFAPFAHFTFRGICFFHPPFLRLQHRSALLHSASPPRTKAPNRSFASFRFTPSFRPALAFPTHTLQNKNSASPAETAAVRRPHYRCGLSASGALAPLADGSPTTLGLILHSVALHFAFKPCFPR